jgi:hypothetical protein
MGEVGLQLYRNEMKRQFCAKTSECSEKSKTVAGREGAALRLRNDISLGLR